MADFLGWRTSSKIAETVSVLLWHLLPTVLSCCTMLTCNAVSEEWDPGLNTRLIHAAHIPEHSLKMTSSSFLCTRGMTAVLCEVFRGVFHMPNHIGA